MSPRAASAAARLAVIDDLPTPPLPLPTAITRVVADTSVGGACCDACQRARCIRFERSSWVISSYSTSTSRTPGRPATFELTSLPIWPRNGHAAVVSATFTVTSPSGPTSTPCTMPRSTIDAWSSGSSTPASTRRTSSGLGGGVIGSFMGVLGRTGVSPE